MYVYVKIGLVNWLYIVKLAYSSTVIKTSEIFEGWITIQFCHQSTDF